MPIRVVRIDNGGGKLLERPCSQERRFSYNGAESRRANGDPPDTLREERNMPHSQTMSAKLMLIASVVLVGSLSSQTTSPFVGEWKLKTVSSKPATQEQLLRISAIPGGFVIGGGLTVMSCVVDGKERPFTLPDAKHHTVSCKLINERTLALTVIHDNGKVEYDSITISADGKTMEQVVSGKDWSPINQLIDHVEVWDRQ